MVTGVLLASAQFYLAGHVAATFLGEGERRKYGLGGRQAILVQTGTKDSKWGSDPNFPPMKEFLRGGIVRVYNWSCVSAPSKIPDVACSKKLVPVEYRWKNGLCFVTPSRGSVFSQYVWLIDAQGAVVDAGVKDHPWGLISLIAPGRGDYFQVMPVAP